ncbi:MAG TPA: amidohydrolase family protein [Candidatus Eremiobacteraeota bacterium]|nr:MAG: Amidohydrolase [bacterium ADurb.Bin363]HPZ07863.1 amidohydrolase family protein [Candidatus Eremiobacteraeota bacterium]
MIIDAHAHIQELIGSSWNSPPERLISLMDRAGIDKAIVMTYSDMPGSDSELLRYVAEATQEYPARLIGFARLNPGYGPLSEELLVLAITKMGMKGLKLHPVGYGIHPGNEVTIKLIKKAAEFNAPTLFHCGDEEYTLPLQIAEAAKKCSEATIILGHMGGYFHVQDAIRVAEKYPNIILETSAMPYPYLIRETVDRIGPERVLFASDGPGCDPLLERKKVELANLSKKEIELIFSENIIKILEKVKKY